MNIKLLTEHHFEFLSLEMGCRGLSESTPVKMPPCLKSHVVAHLISPLSLSLYLSLMIAELELMTRELIINQTKHKTQRKQYTKQFTHDNSHRLRMDTCRNYVGGVKYVLTAKSLPCVLLCTGCLTLKFNASSQGNNQYNERVHNSA